MKQKRKFLLLFILIACLVLGGVGLKKYNDHLDYLEYASNTYTYDYSQIKELEAQEYSFTTALSDVLIYQIEGENLLKEVNTFDVQYFIEGEPILADSDVIMFDFISEEKKKDLYATDIILEYKISESETVESLKLKANFKNASIKSLLIDVSKAFNPADYVVEVKDSTSNVKFEIPLPAKLSEDIQLLYDSEVLLDRFVGPKKIVLLSNKFIDIEEDEMFDFVYEGGFENVDAEYLNAVKKAFDSLPLNLKKHAVLSNLKISGSEYEFVDDAYMEDMNSQYGNNDTIEDFKSFVGAFYDYSVNKIIFNVNKTFGGMHYDYINSFNNGDSISYDVDGDEYSKYKYGNKEELNFYNITDIKNYQVSEMESTFYHEFGHYIDLNSQVPYKLSEEEMQALRKEYPYNIPNNFDFEFIANAFSVYFMDNEYLKNNLPDMYSKLDDLVNNINMDKVKNYEYYVDYTKNWDN